MFRTHCLQFTCATFFITFGNFLKASKIKRHTCALSLVSYKKMDIFFKKPTADAVAKITKTSHWCKLLSEAEKLVQYSPQFEEAKLIDIQQLQTGQYSDLKACHPIVEVIRDFAHGNKEYGLLTLIFAKVAGSVNLNKNGITDTTLLQRQKWLADTVEYTRLAFRLHNKIVNVGRSPRTFLGEEIKTNDVAEINKISLLYGSWALSRAHWLLATIDNGTVLTLISNAIRDMTESYFCQTGIMPLCSFFNSTSSAYLSSKQKMPIESAAALNWEHQHFLSKASLIAHSLKGAVLLAGFGDAKQTHAYEFGKYFILALKVYLDLEELRSGPKDKPFDLTLAPVVLHLEQDETLHKELENELKMSDNVDFTKVRYTVMTQGPGIHLTKKLANYYVKKAIHHLEMFENNEARMILHEITSLLSFGNE